MSIDETTAAWLQDRGISETTLPRWPVAAASVTFPDRGKVHSVVFGYTRKGERINFKARSLDGRSFRQQTGGKARFWNLDRVLDGPQDVVYVTEGEMDALSLAEAGIPEHAILSVPNGAPSEEPSPDSAKMAFALEALEEGLDAQKYVLATDNDGPGRYLRQALAQVLGKARCWYVDWPQDIKDANEHLQWHGADALRRYVHELQQPWPIIGIYTLDDLPEPPELETWRPGFPEWESKVQLAPTMVSVMTGFPGHGKSHFAHQLWHQIARDYDFRVGLFAAETPTLPYIRRYHRQFYAGCLERDMDDEARIWADNWIRDHLIFVQHPNRRPTFAWLMDRIEAAAQRYGCRAVLIDPWNKLEADYDRNQQSETQWIGDCLDELLDAARSLNIHIQIVAHPAKPEYQARKSPPTGYSLHGSAHWNNRVDQGFTMHRPEVIGDDGVRRTEADFYQWKARFEELGYPCKLGMDLDLQTGIYHSTDYRSF